MIKHRQKIFASLEFDFFRVQLKFAFRKGRKNILMQNAPIIMLNFHKIIIQLNKRKTFISWFCTFDKM